MVYNGEHLLIGQFGSFCLTASFAFTLLATLAFALSTFGKGQKKEFYLKAGKLSFLIHAVFLITAIATMFYMLAGHYFEYHYVWQHSSRDMPMRYIFSSFWEGQEGSFLLWLFWQAVLGVILLFSEKKMLGAVMFPFSIVQLILGSMVLGVYLGSSNIGSNPFAFLLREHPDYMHLPLFGNPDYLMILDGRGLNPSLQNYWMTIHPPTLFLGFGLVTIPFAYAVGSLLLNEYKIWVKPTLKWAFIGIGILGLGILMGGAWAYEALSFGGFWAWDPVENAVLVPWLIFLAGGHLLIVYKNKKKSLISALVFILLSFFFVVYSTFLTRSGVLGETSVHAFVDLGLNAQLLFFLILSALPLLLVIFRFGTLRDKNEEPFWTREFWMFLGSMALLLASLQITFSTSKPVINKLFGTSLAPPSDVISHYHKYQIYAVILIQAFMTISFLLKYSKNKSSNFIPKLVFPVIGSILLTALVCIIVGVQNFTVGIYLDELHPLYNWSGEINSTSFIILLFFTFFNLLASFEILGNWIKTKKRNIGSSVAHGGFALLILGATISMSQQHIISINNSGVDVQALGDALKNQENILLYKGDTLKMSKYYLSYAEKKKTENYVTFQVDYFLPKENGSLEKQFSLFPRVQLNDRMGNISEPDTKHFLHKDIYTHVTYAVLDDVKFDNPEEYTRDPKMHTIHERDTFFSSNAMVILDSIIKAVKPQSLGLKDDDIAVGAFLTVKTMDKKEYYANPIFVLHPNGAVNTIASEVPEVGNRFIFTKINPQTLEFDIGVAENNANYKDFIVMRAIIFPFINVLWVGIILMFLGTCYAVYERSRKTKNG